MKRKAETQDVAQNALETVVDLVNNPKVHDIVFLVGKEKQRMYALSGILSKSHCSLAAMINSEIQAPEGWASFSWPDEIPVPDTTPQIFLEMLHFLYTGEPRDYASLDYVSELGLWKLANKFIIDELARICEEGISTRMSLENLFDVACCTHLLPDSLREKAGSIARDNFEEVLAQVDKLKMCGEFVIDNVVLAMNSDELGHRLLCKWAYVTGLNIYKIEEKLASLDVSRISKATMLHFKYVARPWPRMVIDKWERYIRTSSISPIPRTLQDYQTENGVAAVLRLRIPSFDPATNFYESKRYSGFYWDSRPLSWAFCVDRHVDDPTYYGLFLRAHWVGHKRPLSLHGLGVTLGKGDSVVFFAPGGEVEKTGQGRGWGKYMTRKTLEERLNDKDHTILLYILRR